MANSESADPSFFERERDRLTAEITSSFEDLLSSTNRLNRQVEGVLEMTKEYQTISTFWDDFHRVMKSQSASSNDTSEIHNNEHDGDKTVHQERREQRGGSGDGDETFRAGGGRDGGSEDGDEESERMAGFPGTGGHVLRSSGKG